VIEGDDRFSTALRRAADSIWEQQHQHPFVRGIGSGTVPRHQFERWVRQDYQFLIEYCRLFGFAAARSPDLPTLVRFAELLQTTVTTEMDLHRDFAARFGISRSELEAEAMAPATRAYTNFLLRTAALSDFAELAAALLPCMWGFSEIGLRLAAGPRPGNPLCAAWIDAYADPEFQKLAGWCRELVDRLAVEAGSSLRIRMSDAFLTSSRYELDFWSV